MWQTFINWLKGLFGSKDSTSLNDHPEKNVDFPFTGVINDDPDPRDRIFEETKK